MKPLHEAALIAAYLFACYLLVGTLDRDSAIVSSKIVASGPKPITYTIKQDSPGLQHMERNGYEKAPLPLTHPLDRQ